MKKTFISSTIALVALFILSGGTVFAQNQAVLPNAGLTPESNFYFLDKFGETLREFFTFNPEGKARLQITFASERIAEIKVILETKGVEAKGLGVAQSRLQAQLASAAAIVTNLKSEGKDVGALASELSNAIEKPKSVLAQTFKEQKRALEAKEEELKTQLQAAHRAGDTAKEEALAAELGKIKAQKELLGLKEEDIDDDIEAEEERIEEQMEAQRKAEKAIREAQKEKQEVLDEAADEDVAVPAEAFGKFDSLLAQAKSALAAGNFPEARRLAKQAEKNLDAVEDAIEDLEEAKEKAEELKEEQGEKEQEVKEEQEYEEDEEKVEEEKTSVTPQKTLAPVPKLPQSLTIPSVSLLKGTVGVPYKAILSAKGGSPPYVWNPTAGGVPGVNLIPETGILSGTPEMAGTYSLTVEVSDSARNRASRQFTIVVGAGSQPSTPESTIDSAPTLVTPILSPKVQQLQGLWKWDSTLATQIESTPLPEQKEGGGSRYISFKENEICILFNDTIPTSCTDVYRSFTVSGDEILIGLSGQNLYNKSDKLEWHRFRQTGSEKNNDYSYAKIKEIYVRLSSKPLD